MHASGQRCIGGDEQTEKQDFVSIPSGTVAFVNSSSRAEVYHFLKLRCCWFMEELAPHNAYHAKWATEALLSASRAGLPLGSYAGYARKVLEGHCGPGVLEIALGKSSSILKGLDTCFETCPPGEVEVTCPLSKDGEVVIQLDLPGPLSAQDLELSASPGLLDLSIPMQPGCPGLLPGCHGLLLVLPRAVAPHSAKARLSCGGRRLRVSFVAA